MHDPLHRLYRTKLTLLAFVLLAVGAFFLFWDSASQPALIASWPIRDIGSALFTTGLLGVALHYVDGADSEVRDTMRLRRVLRDSAEDIRDAVINGFAFKPDDLARVSTPETLDKIITNGLALRLGDQNLASEVYGDLRRQAVEIGERLHDARIVVSLSMDRSTTEGRAVPFVATVRWEYDLRPASATRRFVAVSDSDEFRSLAAEGTATSAWFVNPRTGLDAEARGTFELVDFSVDGVERPIRRTTKTGSQVYSVNLGREAMEADRRVHVSYTYRTLLAADGHLLQLRVDQPTRGLVVELDYTEVPVGHVNVLDFISSSSRTRVTRSSPQVAERQVGVEFDGWVFPRSGVAFVWGDPAGAEPAGDVGAGDVR